MGLTSAGASDILASDFSFEYLIHRNENSKLLSTSCNDLDFHNGLESCYLMPSFPSFTLYKKRRK